MPEDITISVPKKLAKFIDSLVEEEYYSSREDYGRCAIELIGELYGYSKSRKGGKELVEIIKEVGLAPKQKIVKHPTQPQSIKKPVETKPKEKIPQLTPEEYDLIDLFAGSSFEFEEALHAKFTMEQMKQGKSPAPRADFIAKLEKLQEKGKIEKSYHNGKVVWKLLEKY
ncbi:MAG: ribbon-helix-helix domain-containing protein [Asgard group archaeon]|nr:ribbon-helix-helix domain-containing protein [Asgard group archaeon]